MIFVYNFLQAILLVVAAPLLLLVVLGRKKYRARIRERLGSGLAQKLSGLEAGNKTVVWIHSLSVGEVTSALPLVAGLRKELDDICIVFSATTRTGMQIAEEKIRPHVDLVFAAPLDLLPVIQHFLRLIRPEIFVLVETDFWPNWLFALKKRSTHLVLVNGRISRSSFAKYKRFRLFFSPLFKSFSLLSMQTDTDAEQMRRLGVPGERIQTLGNLKYGSRLPDTSETRLQATQFDSRIPAASQVWVCGSTHQGEEEIILTVFNRLLQVKHDLFLILAPRDPGRSGEIQKLITDQGHRFMRRSCPADPVAPLLILDTLGELAGCYQFARVAFVGGSLADCGGHNPLEPAAYEVPVLFGPHMEDFLEIARDLVTCDAAVTVDSADRLEKTVRMILEDESLHQNMSTAARNLVNQNSGVIQRHVRMLATLLPNRSARN